MRINFMDFKRLMAPFGITDANFLSGIYTQLMNADGFGSEGLEFAVSVITGISPKDQLDVMLGAQTAVMQMATMKQMRKLGSTEVGSASQDSVERTATKLSRICISLVDALKRHRTGGEQKITVQHVSVADGGQAIVGSVTQNALEKPADEMMAIAAPSQVPMSKLDPESLEDVAQSWRDYKEKAALVEASQPKVPLPDKSQSKPAALRRPGKVRHKRSSSTTATVGYPPPPPRPRR
jgi:hypothetical protein